MNRILNLPENKVSMDMFGAGKHGANDSFEVGVGNGTKIRAQTENVIIEELTRTVEQEFELSGPEVSISDQKYNQLAHLVYGIPSAQAAMNLSEMNTGGGNYITGCQTQIFANDYTLLKQQAFVLWGEGFQASRHGNDKYTNYHDYGKSEDPRAVVSAGNIAMVVVGTNGYILRLEDAVTTSEPASGTTEDLLSIALFTNIMVACGNGGKVIRSTDYGQNWENATPPGAGVAPFVKVLVAGSQFALFQSTGECYTSTTGISGSWVEHDTTLPDVADAAYLNLSNRLIAASSTGLAIASTTSFATASTVTPISGCAGGLYSLVANPDGYLLVAVGKDLDGFPVVGYNIGANWGSSWRYRRFRNGGNLFYWYAEAATDAFFANGRLIIPNNNTYILQSDPAWRRD